MKAAFIIIVSVCIVSILLNMAFLRRIRKLIDENLAFKRAIEEKFIEKMLPIESKEELSKLTQHEFDDKDIEKMMNAKIIRVYKIKEDDEDEKENGGKK